jgi:hypothetical protein
VISVVPLTNLGVNVPMRKETAHITCGVFLSR